MDILAGLLIVWSYYLLGKKAKESHFWGWLINTIGNGLFIFWVIIQEKTPWGLLILSIIMLIIGLINCKKNFWSIK